jgi:MoaA/NifB/PqqE/SkfB family radical SAM enzyme
MTDNKPVVKIPTVPDHVASNKKIDWLCYAANKFCTLPWLNLNTNPNGNIKLCCNITREHFVNKDDGNNTPFNLGYDDIEDIWNSVYMSSTRTVHRQNIGSNECSECYTTERLTGHSPRMGQNVMWLGIKNKGDELLQSHFGKVADTEIFENTTLLPLSLELRLGNQCNLKCLTCWSISSSLVYNERLDIVKKDLLKDNNLGWLEPIWKEEITRVDNDNIDEWYETEIFYSNIRKMAPNLRRLYTTGGEPTLIKANYKMLEMLLEAGNTKCSVEFTSNMTTWNYKFYDALSKFENVEIQMSLDGIDDTAELIRHGCDFKIVRENVERVMELASNKPKWRVKCFTVFQALNYDKLFGLWEMLDDLTIRYSKRIDWWPITLQYPAHLSLAAVPIEERLSKLESILLESQKYMDGQKYFTLGEGTVITMKDSMTNTPYSEELNVKFKNYLPFITSYRKNNGR